MGFVPHPNLPRYVWLGDIPLAVIDQNAAGAKTATYFIETDFANTPRYLRRATGDLTKAVWYWPPAPYGDSTAGEDSDGDGVRVAFNLRYPGQYFDAESKLHYNHTRYFQPRTGRYLQPDLIGLDGGINVYTYAGGNPVMYMDPTGTIFDILFDIFSIGMDLLFISDEGFTPTNTAALLGDIGGAFVPGLTGVGASIRATNAADNMWDAAKAADVAQYNKLADNCLDCSDIASIFNRKYSGGYTLELTPQNGNWMKGIEYGKKEEFMYHQVYVNGKYTYDPMFDNKPVLTSEFIKAYQAMNPNGINLLRR